MGLEHLKDLFENPWFFTDQNVEHDCCYRYAVCDYRKLEELEHPLYDARNSVLCELRTKEDAEMICAALNLWEKEKRK